MRIRRIQPQKLTTDGLIRFVLCLYFVISIFEPYLNGIIGTVTKYYMFFVMLVLLWRDGFVLKLRDISFLYIIWLVFKLITLLWSEDYRIPKLHFISQVGMVMYLVILLSGERDKKTLDAIETVYWLSSLAIGVLSIFFSDAYRGTAEARQVLTIMGVEIDPNNQAALLLVGIALSANNLLYQKRRIFLSVVGLVINCYACFNTSSRAGIVTITVLAVCCVLYSPEKRNVKTVFRNVALLCGAGGVLYVAAVYFLPEANFERLFDLSGYGSGSGRVQLWAKSWDVFTKDLLTALFGAGWGTVTLYTNGVVVHNTFLSLLCDVGVLGTLLFMVPIIVIALRLLKRKEPMSVLLLGAQFIPSFFIDAINKRFFWNAILLLFLCYLHQQDPVEGQQK